MRLYPTVLIGIGSTGKHIVANVEKYLYEVLDAESLGIFRFIVLETAKDQNLDTSLPSGNRTVPADIKVSDLGAAYLGLRNGLGNEFDWCPPDLRIDGPGAGNMRAGGRLMLFANMDRVAALIGDAIHDVGSAAATAQPGQLLNRLLGDRGSNTIDDPFDRVPAVIVVGTLAGGTGSGICTDLAYLIRRIQPTSMREAYFVLPDETEIDTYKANSWAAIKDIEYFTKNPDKYRAVWLNNAQNRVEYDSSSSPAAPFDYVYLISQRDKSGNLDMRFEGKPSCPLLTMIGMMISANLLGLYALRQERLVDLPQRVGNDRVMKTFLTASLRGVSYPKYEISEAASCKIIANRICEGWLGKAKHIVRGSWQDLQREEIQKKGRETWAKASARTLSGLGGNVDIPALVEKIQTGEIPKEDVPRHLFGLLTEHTQGSLYSQVDQNVSGRLRLLQAEIKENLAAVLQESQNLQFASWYLEGMQSEIDSTRKYWAALMVPGSDDIAGWQKLIRKMIEDFRDQFESIPVLLVVEKKQNIYDQINEMVTRLEMFLMSKPLAQLSDWIDSEMHASIARLRALLDDLKGLAESRALELETSLNDRSGPVLKISRSQDKQFMFEIEQLSKVEPSISASDYIRLVAAGFEGLFPLKTSSVAGEKERLFLDLKSRIQSQLIKQQRQGSIDITTEIQQQGVVNLAVKRAEASKNLSVPTKVPLVTGKDNVPAYVLAKSQDAASKLAKELADVDPAFPKDLAAKELPLFDYAAFFYQEGAKLTPEVLKHADSLKRAFDDKCRVDRKTIDPLASLKNEN